MVSDDVMACQVAACDWLMMMSSLGIYRAAEAGQGSFALDYLEY